MLVKIEIDRTLAIKSGNENYGRQYFNINLSKLNQKTLDFIATNATYGTTSDRDSQPYFTFNLDLFKIYDDNDNVSGHMYPKFGDLRQENDLIKAIESIVDTILVLREKNEINKAKFREKMWLSLKSGCANYTSYHVERTFKGTDHEIEAIEMLNKNEQIRQEKETKARAEEKAKKLEEEKIEAEEKAKKLEKEIKRLEPLKTWALKNGSEKTRLMLKNDFETWTSSAQKDYVQHIIDTRLPDFVIGASDGDKRKNPTLKELESFDFVAELAKNESTLFDSPQIERITIEANEDNDYQESYETEIQIKVICLDNSTHWISKTM